MDKVYGVVVVDKHFQEGKTKYQIWSSHNPALLFNKGCEAVFLLETDAKSYAYEQAQITSLPLDMSVVDLD